MLASSMQKVSIKVLMLWFDPATPQLEHLVTGKFNLLSRGNRRKDRDERLPVATLFVSALQIVTDDISYHLLVSSFMKEVKQCSNRVY